ncbi:MAG: UDP-glucose 4-epimerase GalE [Methylovirgula sp.]
MAVLVTGGAGYIGGHMVLALLNAGEEVVVLDDLSTGFAWAVPKAAHLVVGDVADLVQLRKIIAEHRIDSIAHFAAKIVVPDSVADPLGYYFSNTVKARALAEFAVGSGIKNFIFSSTAAVYGEPAVNPIFETAQPAPINPYGRSKLMVEWMLEDAAKVHDLSYVALRYFNVAGADPKGRIGQSTPNATHLIKVAVQAALGLRRGMDVFGTDYPTPDGTCVRDYIQVSDLIAAHLLALAHLRRNGESLVLNCGYGHGHSVREVIDVVKKVSGTDFEVRLTGRRAGDSAALVAGAQAVREKLGWKPNYDNLTEIVRQAYQWERQLRDGTFAKAR